MSVGLSPELTATFRTAAGLMNQRRFAEARALLEPAVLAAPAVADARYLLGAALKALGQFPPAERELRAALVLAPGREDVLLDLARVLAATGQFAAVVEITAPAVGMERPREALLVERAKALQALGRIDESLDLRERVVALSPGKASSLHNLAATLGDVGLAERAEASARAAFAAGGDAPETWLVLARALQSQNRFDEAQAAFADAVSRRPGYVDALRDLAQLIWMRTGDLEAATAVLSGSLAGGEGARLRALKARMFDYAGDARGGYAVLVGGGVGGDPVLEITAAHLALAFDPQLALAHASRAAALAPGDDAVQRKLIDVYLAAGHADEALDALEPQLAARPLDQGLIAAQWMAWRALGHSRAQDLYDYETMISVSLIDVPAGWSQREDYLADLAEALRDLHQLHTHPLDQSLRHGTQTSANLLRSENPAIRAFKTAIDGPIRRHMAFIGQGADQLRARNTGDYAVSGMWSVRLKSDGFHVDHVHPMGWLSSACYITLPDAVEDGGRQGWIKFGEPGVPMSPPLAPEHFVKPEPGMLVLFPSYMWHGTVPFSGAGERLTVAFDVVPLDGFRSS